MTRREAQRRIVGLVAEAEALREKRRELSRRLRRLREEVAVLLPLAGVGSGGKKDGHESLAAKGPLESGVHTHERKVAERESEGKTGIGRGEE